jgi:hypothetical protein
MVGIKKPLIAILLWQLFVPTAWAEDRPSEADIFGAPTPAPAVPEPSTPETDVGTIDHPWQFGGSIFQRAAASKQSGQSWSDNYSLPLQIETFADVRPNDRLRFFVNARGVYDPSRDEQDEVAGQDSSAISFQNGSTSDNPDAVLDQAWVKFDVARSVFVTAGKQHVKWGTARFWNPTDFINAERRDPLSSRDLRTGKNMVRFVVPWEKTQTNFSAIALFDSPDAEDRAEKLGGAFRVESVWGDAEMGLDAVTRHNRKPVYGADISTALGQMDVYAEAAVLTDDVIVFRKTSEMAPGADLATLFTMRREEGPFVQWSLGTNYAFAWQENRQATVGVEYFYNPMGQEDRSLYPIMLFLGQYEPLYVGKRYAAFYLTAEGLDALKHTSYTFSTLTNLSDRSSLARAGLSWEIQTHLVFETYLQYHFGTRGGEFNFSLDTPELTSGSQSIEPIKVPTTVYDLGLSLHYSF